ncbi:hypothetical protein AVEN_105585-1 [Araneus ventricosus]|uniref:Uncharacterized protein n=1 Tax=Araneus ventricosus TaxID=182803 RepID=A0A4Y2WUH2_ARAVE|nr:hypothetical protein AVEN_105585-1 [Araneus ventricosus]
MDSSVRPFPLFSSLRVVGDMNDKPFISNLSLRVLLMTTRPTVFSPLSEQQPAEIRPIGIEVAWPVTAGLGGRVLRGEHNLGNSVRDETLNIQSISLGCSSVKKRKPTSQPIRRKHFPTFEAAYLLLSCCRQQVSKQHL